MKNSIMYFETKKIENLNTNLIGGKTEVSGPGNLHVCPTEEGGKVKDLFYSSDIVKTDRWFFKDSIRYNFE